MPSSAEFQSSNGQPAEDVILELRRALTLTQADLLYAGQRQNERIHDRTEHHVDVDGNPFAPYSTKGPYYYRPWDSASLGRGTKGVGLAARRAKVPEASRNRSAQRFLSRLGGGGGSGLHSLFGLEFDSRAAIATIHPKEPDTVRFASYAAFKSALGRSGVDLVGPADPHMMQAIQVSATTDEIRIGIYDDKKAAIGTGHNTGAGHLPQRRFFGASANDPKQMLTEIYTAVKARLKP
jgi:hypothetical protein